MIKKLSKMILLIGTIFIVACDTRSTPNNSTSTDDPIIIGDLFPYQGVPNLGDHYRIGWELAVKHQQEKGGINGRPIKVVSRDHTTDPAKGIQIAEDIILRDGADIIAGTVLANLTNGIAETANRNNIPMVSIWNSKRISDGPQTPTLFSVVASDASAYMAAEVAKGMDIQKWATLAPNFVYGHMVSDIFTRELQDQKPSVQIVEQQFPAVGKLEGGATVNALKAAGATGIFNATFTQDLTRFVRAGKGRALFEQANVISLEIIPEYYSVLSGIIPDGWTVFGYPYDQIDRPAHEAFLRDFRDLHGQDPGWYSLDGYITYQFVFAGLEAAESADADAFSDAMKGISVDSPIGQLTMDKKVHRSDMGWWVGKIQKQDNGAPRMINWDYHSAAPYLPTLSD